MTHAWWFPITASEPRPLRRPHGDDCYLEHPQCAQARITRAIAAATEVRDARPVSRGAQRTAEKLLDVLTGRDVADKPIIDGGAA